MKITVESLRDSWGKLENDPGVRRFYDNYPRNEFWKSENRKTSTDILLSAVDLLDMIHRMQKTFLFSINTDENVKSLAVGWLVTRFQVAGIDVRTMAANVEESLFSDPTISVDWFGRRLSIDFLRTLSVASDIKRHIQTNNRPFQVLELGAGLGHLARTMRLMGVSRSHVIFDLPESLVFSCAFLATNFPDASIFFVSDINEARTVRTGDFDFVFIPSCFAEDVDISGCELFVNTASMGEMRNETIRYWMDFVQSKTSIKHLFTQNRYLNTIDAQLHASRLQENEASVHYDANWTILKWDLEPAWFRCPYIAPIAARHLEIAATREPARNAGASKARAEELLSQVKLEDWYRFSDRPSYMSMGQNAFVTDVTITGALFKLWESIRLHPTAEAVQALRKYLMTHLHDKTTEFEESRFYDDLFVRLAQRSNDASLREEADEVQESRSRRPVIGKITLVGETREYNLILAEPLQTDLVPIHLAVAKALGHIELFHERIGEREFPPYVLVSDSLDGARRFAEAHEQEQVELVGADSGYSIVKTSKGYLAIAQSLGHVACFVERIGERDLSPVLFRGSTEDEIKQKIAAVKFASIGPAHRGEG